MINSLNERIHDLRELSRMTQTDLARRLGVTRACVNAWEMGSSNPSLENLIALSRIFHTSTDYLLGCQNKESIFIDDYSVRDKEILRDLLNYIEGCREIEKRLKK